MREDLGKDYDREVDGEDVVCTGYDKPVRRGFSYNGWSKGEK